MQPTGFGLLSLITFLPVLGMLLVLLLPASQTKAIKGLAISVSVLTFAASVFAALGFESGQFRFQHVEMVKWMPAVGINYRMGVDGISIWLVVLTTFLSIFAFAYSTYVQTRVKAFMALLLLLETAVIGSFLALDMVLFYSFFELTLMPMYFLVAVWGGEGRRYAAAKFVIYTFAGSIFMLVGMIAVAVLYFKNLGVWTFSILDIQAAAARGQLWVGNLQAEAFVFWAFAIAFLVKSPAFPFHTWIADTYAEAPTAGPILSSVMVKMGTYGMLRFCLPFFPDVIARQIPWLMGLAVIGIVYGAIVACVQSDMRRLLAYSSVSHMGFILLGIFSLSSIGMVGGAYQQLSHGITATALFLLVGYLVQRRGTASFREYGGLKAQMPVFAALFLVSMFASVGLPGLNGFVGEFLALIGAYQSGYEGNFGLSPAFAVLAAGGVVVAAVYLLYMFQQIFYGPNLNPANRRLRDLKPWESALAGILVVVMIWGGLYPSTFTKPMEASLEAARMMATADGAQRPTWSDSDSSHPQAPDVPGAFTQGRLGPVGRR